MRLSHRIGPTQWSSKDWAVALQIAGKLEDPRVSYIYLSFEIDDSRAGQAY